jgi:hypothetical protein
VQMTVFLCQAASGGAAMQMIAKGQWILPEVTEGPEVNAGSSLDRGALRDALPDA